MKNIVYLVPFDAVGGVEVAAKELLDISSKNFTFNIEYVFNNKFEVFYPFKLLKSVRRVIKSRPNVLILSLWRAVIVGLLVKLFLPKVRLVLFIHSEKDTHMIDFLFTRIGLFFSLEVWGDSVSSINKRFHLLLKIKKIKKIKKISFNFEKINRVVFGGVRPNFIFWGRLSAEKNIGRSLIIFSNILKLYPDAVYKIIGPDCGELEKLKQFCVELKINNSVLFFKQMDFISIQEHAKSASFYLQTSLFEGAAMSVIESMKLGLIPVVTPVGDIERYCTNSNSVTIYSDNQAVRDVAIILSGYQSYQKLRDGALLTWSGRGTYKSDIISACSKIANNIV